MIEKIFSGLDQPDEKRAQKLLRSAGLAYGFVFGLFFSIVIWGYDGLILNSCSADLAWTNCLIGLPFSLIIGTAAGFVGALTPWSTVTISAWVVASGLLGLVAGHIPFTGRSLAISLLDPTYANASIYPFMHSNEVRTILVILVQFVLGAAVGVLEIRAIEWAWDQANQKARLTLRSWLALFVCIPLILIQAGPINELIMKPLRNPYQRINDLIQATLTGGVDEVAAQNLSTSIAKRFGERFTTDYKTHFVEFYNVTETQYTAYIDITFSNDFHMRCVTAGRNVNFCDDFSKRLTGWMDDLVQLGLSGDIYWLNKPTQALSLEDHVIEWLVEHQSQLSESYEISRVNQKGGWILMQAQFDTGFDMTCRFHGATPVVVDQCSTSAN